MPMRIDWLKLIISIVGCEIVGSLGSIFTASQIPSWYAGLVKPAFNPPNWVFGPVWTTLFALIGIAFYLVWMERARTKTAANAAMIIFGIQFVFNILWSALFFGLNSPLYGMVCIVILWASIAMTIIAFYRVTKPAAYLLVPYILWVSFAAVLNYAILTLN